MKLRIFSLALLLGWAGVASATTVLKAPLDALVDSSAVVVHAKVKAVDDDLSTSKRGPFRTAIDLEILETIKGPERAALRLVLPGGRAGDLTMAIPGMPTFVAGEEVVLILEATSTGFALAGLGQGVFKIERIGQDYIANRDLRGVHLVERSGKPTGPDLGPPKELASLLNVLRGLAGKGVSP